MEQAKNLFRSLKLASPLAALVLLSAMAQAQTITVLHNFTEGADGAEPYAGVTVDRAGNLYGTTTTSVNGEGTVFKMSHQGSGWVLSTIHAFTQAGDGELPLARVVFGPDGTLYGTTVYGGQGSNGIVFNLRPPATVCKSVSCPWTETVLYNFTGGSDGASPYLGDLIFDAAGNIYGTTILGGAFGLGTVFKLTRSGGGWSESVLHSFTGGDDGAFPQNGVAFDSAGNLYGTATDGGSFDFGTVYELSPSGSGWTENTIYTFNGVSDNEYPVGSVVIDGHGNLYGTTSPSNSLAAGTVWELTSSGGNWSLTTLQQLIGYEGPFDTPTLDAAGNVYGTFTGNGAVFKLSSSDGGWTYTSYSFTGDNGQTPIGGVSLDASGNLYGTTAGGGTGHGQNCSGCGVVWEITP